jgi:hypothetical protein
MKTVHEAVNDAMSWIKAMNHALHGSPFSVVGAHYGDAVHMTLHHKPWWGAEIVVKHIVDIKSLAMGSHPAMADAIMQEAFGYAMHEIRKAENQKIEYFFETAKVQVALESKVKHYKEHKSIDGAIHYFQKVDIPQSPDVEIFKKGSPAYVSMSMKAGLPPDHPAFKTIQLLPEPVALPAPVKVHPGTVLSLKQLGLVEGVELGTVVPDPEAKPLPPGVYPDLSMLGAGVTFLPHGEPKCPAPPKPKPAPKCLLDD